MFMCQMCQHESMSARQYNAHQFFHRNSYNCRFICVYPFCGKEFTKYKNFKMHLLRNHSNQKLSGIAVKNFSCNIQRCTGFQSRDIKIFLSHLCQHLKESDCSTIQCPHDNCKNSVLKFNNISTLRSHFYRKHYETDSGHTEIHLNIGHDVSSNEEVNTDMVVNQQSLSVSFQYDDAADSTYRKILSTMYLTLQTKHFLTDSALQTIITGLSDINDITHHKLIQELTKENVHIGNKIIEKNNLFYQFHNSIDGPMRTTFCRKKYYKDNYNYISPVCITLEKCSMDETNNEVKKISKFFYVPLLETIKVLLSNPSFYNQCMKNSEVSSNDVFTDITDGEVYKNNNFFYNNPSGLRLILYQDAFEVCNPLGSSRKVHKLVGIYMQIANVPPHNRSRTDLIQLVALCYEKDIQEFGFSKIFSIIVKDLKYLETEGVFINTPEGVKQINGCVIAMAGDNLGSHQIGGFVENFSSTQYFCRYCHVTKNDIDRGKIHGFPFRTKQSYDFDASVASISGNHCKGIKFDSILNQLNYYHVCNPGLPPCLGHDLFEGVIQQDLMLAINYFVSKKIINFEDLNTRLQNVRFSNEVRHEAIPRLKKCQKLNGNASENMRLLLIFPFAFYDVINNSDLVWKMILLLRKICFLILSLRISIGQIAYLQNLLVEYIDMRKTLFPLENLLRKHHFILHYVKLIFKFGPLRHLWTMRFESKHKYFKTILKHSSNYKNVLQTLSEKHQLLQALILSQLNAGFKDKVVSDSAILFTYENYPNNVSDTIKKCCKFEQTMFIANAAEFRGTVYKNKMYVCFGQNENGCYLLCHIKYIIINKSYTDLCFYGIKYEIVEDTDIGLYVAKKQYDEPICIPYHAITPHEPVLQYITPFHLSLFSFKSEPFNAL